MGLFEISRELQFRVCNHGEAHSSAHTAREEELFYREEKEVGRATVNKESTAFHWQSCCQERREGHSSSYWALLLSQGVRAPLFWSLDSI